MIGYAKYFDSYKAMSFKVIDKKLFKKYTKIWEIVRILMNSKPVCGDNDKYIKTKIKLYRDNVNTNFQGRKVPKENASYECILLVMIDSVIKVNLSLLSSNTFGRM